MHEHERKLRPAIAAIVFVCFFMPFLKVSCGGQPILSVTGFDLATGKDVQPTDPFASLKNAGFQPDPSGRTNAIPDSVWAKTPMAQYGGVDQSNQPGSTVDFAPTDPYSEPDPFGQMQGMDGDVKAEPVAAGAMGLAAIALVASLATGRFPKIIVTVAASVCAVCLFILKSKSTGDIPPEAAAILAVEWTTAFWVSCIGSLALAAYTFHLLTQRDSDRERPKLVIQAYEPAEKKSPQEKVPQQ